MNILGYAGIGFLALTPLALAALYGWQHRSLPARASLAARNRRLGYQLEGYKVALDKAHTQMLRHKTQALQLARRLEEQEQAFSIAVDMERARDAVLQDVCRVAYIGGQGFGYFSPQAWAGVPEGARQRVQILAVCPTEQAAQLIVKGLPQEWRNSTTWYKPGTGEARW